MLNSLFIALPAWQAFLPSNSLDPMDTLADRHVLARDRWSSSRIAREVGPYHMPSKLPEKEPSVLRDMGCGTRQLLSELKGKHWLEAFGLVVIALFFSGLSFLYWEMAFWAAWEKLAWRWNKSNGQRPPRWHRYYAHSVALVWALVFAFPTLLFYGVGVLIRQAFS